MLVVMTDANGNESFYRKLGVCYDFVSDIQYASVLFKSDAEKIVSDPEQYLRRYGGVKLAMRQEPYNGIGIVYGYVNGEPCYSADEFVYKHRRRGPIETDAELIEFARKVTSNWYNSGWHHSFEDFYLSDYALSEPYHSLTRAEFARLKELQADAIAKAKAADEAREWRLVETIYWADNSVEEVYEDKDGVRKTVMAIGPHGDVC